MVTITVWLSSPLIVTPERDERAGTRKRRTRKRRRRRRRRTNKLVRIRMMTNKART